MSLFRCSVRFVVSLSLLLVFLGFYFPTKSVGSERKCFIVEEKILCYFSPNASSFYSWDEALAECKDNGATLPDLPSKVIAGVLEKYLESQNVRYRFWTSGRRIENKGWRWIDGQNYNGTAVVKRHAADCQAVVRKDLKYLEQYPIYAKNYVCQYFGPRCESGDVIQLSDGCLVLISKELRNVSDARNNCLERGGDLPVIRTNEDLQNFNAVFSELKDYAQIWIGLQRQWWTWNIENEYADVRFSNWADREGARLYNNCMVVDAVSFKWRQVNCSDEERVLCQTVVPNKSLLENDDTSSSMGGLVAGILIGVLIVAAAVVIAVLILRKRIRLPFDGFRRVKCVDSPMAKPYETKESNTTPSPDVRVTTSEVDQGQYAGLDKRQIPGTSSRGHYEKLNRRQVENRQSHNVVEPRQRQKVDSRQSRKSEPCQGYNYEHFQGQSTEQGQSRRLEPSISVPQHQSHKVEVNEVFAVEPCEGQDSKVFQGQMEDQYQDHYAKIGTADAINGNDDDDQTKTIVYAKLEFDAEASNDEHPFAANQMNPTGGGDISGSESRKTSHQTSIHSPNGLDGLSTKVDAQSGAIIFQDGAHIIQNNN